MTDGIPIHGSMQRSGVFAYEESKSIVDKQGSNLYQYANGVVGYAENYLRNDANVYGYGFFHSLTPDEFIFGEKLIMTAMEQLMTNGMRKTVKLGIRFSRIITRKIIGPVVV